MPYCQPGGVHLTNGGGLASDCTLDLGGALGSEFHRPGDRCVGNERGTDAAVLGDREFDGSSGSRLCGTGRCDGEMQDGRTEASRRGLHALRFDHYLERLNRGALLLQYRHHVRGCTGCNGCEQHIKGAGCGRCITVDSNPRALRSPGLELKASHPLHFNSCCVRDSR